MLDVSLKKSITSFALGSDCSFIIDYYGAQNVVKLTISAVEVVWFIKMNDSHRRVAWYSLLELQGCILAGRKEMIGIGWNELITWDPSWTRERFLPLAPPSWTWISCWDDFTARRKVPKSINPKKYHLNRRNRQPLAAKTSSFPMLINWQLFVYPGVSTSRLSSIALMAKANFTFRLLCGTCVELFHGRLGRPWAWFIVFSFCQRGRRLESRLHSFPKGGSLILESEKLGGNSSSSYVSTTLTCPFLRMQYSISSVPFMYPFLCLTNMQSVAINGLVGNSLSDKPSMAA